MERPDTVAPEVWTSFRKEIMNLGSKAVDYTTQDKIRNTETKDPVPEAGHPGTEDTNDISSYSTGC